MALRIILLPGDGVAAHGGDHQQPLIEIDGDIPVRH